MLSTLRRSVVCAVHGEIVAILALQIWALDAGSAPDAAPMTEITCKNVLETSIRAEKHAARNRALWETCMPARCAEVS